MDETLFERSQIFGMFMLIFQYPDEEFIKLLQNGDLYSTLKLYSESTFDGNINKDLLEKLDLVSREYSAMESNELFSLLKTEYLTLFIGTSKPLAPPYASIYWNNKKQLMAEPAVLLKRLYKEWGFNVSKDYKDLPDHISLQLEFLYQLGENMNQENQKSVYNLQKKVINEIILKWIYPFLENIKDHESLKFYSLSAGILLDILEQY